MSDLLKMKVVGLRVRAPDQLQGLAIFSASMDRL